MASISNPYLSQRFRSLIWSCLDFDLLRTATFFAERYFYVDQDNHEARHLFALALLKSGQAQSALHLVDLPAEARCSSCVEIYAQCCNTLGRYRQGREALEMCINNGGPSDLGAYATVVPRISIYLISSTSSSSRSYTFVQRVACRSR